MDRSRPSLRHGRIRIAVIGLMLLVPAGIATARQLSPPSSSPATGHAQVVTQGIAVLSNEPMIWRVVERTAQPRWEAKAGSRVLGFILASEEPVLLSNINEAGETKDVARLGVGEAFLVEAGTKQIRASMSDQPVPYLSLELVPAADANKVGNGTVLYQSDPFSAPDGERDVDLVRNVLEHNETATLPDTGQPVYILATDGAIDIEPAHGNRTTLETGQSGIFTGELTIKAVTPAASSSNQVGAVRLSVGMLQASDGGAGYVVAVIGDEIPPVQTPTPSPTITPTPSDTPVATDTEEPTDEPTIAQPTEEPIETPTEEPTATSTPNLDFDGDGLLDVDEREYGADPKNPDTDGDGLSDGDEVHTYHTNPAGTDSDGDGLTDGDEVNNYGTDPANADTDGDGLPDGREIESNHDPLDPADPPRLR